MARAYSVVLILWARHHQDLCKVVLLAVAGQGLFKVGRACLRGDTPGVVQKRAGTTTR